MKREIQCPVCGKSFTAERSTQRFCSRACQLLAYRHQQRKHKEYTGGKIIRQFRCLECRAVIRVTSTDDKRTKFCSSHCERAYWKHSKENGVRSQAVLRTFRCRQCGSVVIVTEPKDRRLSFCCADCRIKWNSHARSMTSVGTHRRYR